jgi:hypothetical protein
MSNSSAVQIRLLRKVDRTDQATDDFITVRPANGCGCVLYVKYRDGDGGVTSNLVLYETSLERYIYDVVRLVRNDNDPFLSAQFIFPGLPSVLYSAARLQNPEVLKALRSCAKTVQESWAFSAAEHTAAHEAEDDDTESTDSDASSTTASTDSEDEYADMPALIPTNAAFPPPRRSARLRPNSFTN